MQRWPLTFVVVLVLGAVGVVAAATAGTSLTPEDIARMSLKEIRAALKSRNVRCDDCMEKEHFRAKLLEAVAAGAELEVKAAAEGGDAASENAEKQTGPETSKKQKEKEEPLDPQFIEQLRGAYRKKKNEKDDLMAKLRKAGINAHMFDKDDMSAFDDILGGGPKGGKGKTANKNKKKPSRQAPPPPPSGDDDAISDEF